MPEIRKDLVHDNWVIIANDRALRPYDFPINRHGVEIHGVQNQCPFCEGNETCTTPEITACRSENSAPDTPGWSIRIIPNKFSAFNFPGDMRLDGNGIYTSFHGAGQHEVVVETPEHGMEFHNFSHHKVASIYKMMRERYRVLATDHRVKYILIYKNRGLFAGASMEHSHSQILALPMVPKNINGIPAYFNSHDRCLLCSIIEQEQNQQVRIIAENDAFILLSPYAARFSYETWIVPKRHDGHFGDISDGEIDCLASMVYSFLSVMMECLHDPAYNMVINTSPLDAADSGAYHWFIEITPRLMVVNGMETSCGYFINPAAPEYTAILFREVMDRKNR